MIENLMCIWFIGAVYLFFLSSEDWEVCLIWPLVAIIRGIRKAWMG